MFNKYMQDVKMLNVWNKFNSLLVTASGVIKRAGKEKIEMLKNLANGWFRDFRDSLDKRLEDIIVKEHAVKCTKKPGAYNFTEYSISEEIIDLLNMGKKAVPTFSTPFWYRRARFNSCLVSSLATYRSSVQQKPVIQASWAREWLKIAIEDTKREMILDAEQGSHLIYYQYIFGNLIAAYSRMERSNKLQRSKAHSYVQVKKEMNLANAVYSEADKNLGVALVSCEILRKAQVKMMFELGGVKIKMDKNVLKIFLNDIVTKFEGSLEAADKAVIDSIMSPDNRRLGVKETEIPYLKLNIKMHKLGSQDLRNKDASNAKFRPIQDSVGYVLKPYSKICMLMLRELNEEVKWVYKSIAKIETLSGVSVADEVREKVTNERDFRAIMSTDFESAYTNISKSELNRCVINIAKVVKWPDCNLRLLLKTISLLLDNNYVEICDGIYKLGGQLAMGCSSSGEALDTVAIWSELSCLEGFKNGNSKVNVGSEFEIEIEQIEEPDDENSFNGSEKTTIKFEKRFRDDCLNIVEASDTIVIAGVINKLGNMYPKQLGNNVTLTHVYTSHLDCCIVKRLGGGKPLVLLRRNLKFPVSVIPPESNTYDNYRFAVVGSELLRYRRICKNAAQIKLNDELLINELVSAGYKRTKIIELFKIVIARIESRYDLKNWVRLVEGDSEERPKLWASMEYDGFGDFKVLKQLLQPEKSEVLKWRFVYKNGPMVKSLVINRGKDLKKMKTFVLNEKDGSK